MYQRPQEQQERKDWLGQDIYMVAFLLTVETNRLRELNDTLHDNERNFDQNKKIYDLMIEELQDAESKIKKYHSTQTQLQQDVQEWRSRAEENEKQFKERRYNLDLQRRVLIDKEIRELSDKFIRDRSFLDEENRTIRREIDELKLKHGSAEDLIESTQQLHKENEALRQEILNLRGGYNEMEVILNNAGDLEQENAQLKEEANELDQKIRYLDENGGFMVEEFTRLEEENISLRSQLDSQLQEEMIQQYESEIYKMREQVELYKETNMKMAEKLQQYLNNARYND